MITLIFIIGVINMAIAMAAALYLEPRLHIVPPTILDSLQKLNEQYEVKIAPAKEADSNMADSEAVEDEIDETEVEEEAPEEVEEVEEIPSEWLDMLESESVEAKSFVEASVQVLRLEVGRYREKIVAIEKQIRQLRLNPDQEALQTVMSELKEVNTDWLEKQAEAASHLSGRQGNLGVLEEMGGGLEDVLLDQAAQIETTCSNIDTLDFQTDIENGCQRLIIETCRLVDLAHILRDRMQESLISIMRVDNRLETLDRRMQNDALSGLLNRNGLEVAMHEWWRDDPARQRLVSVALFDLDRFAKVNSQFGTLTGDRVLGAFGRLLDELVSENRGQDRAARLDGQSFLIFFGDSGPRQATSVAERIRQTLEATTFTTEDGGEIELTISCGVIEGDKNDTSTLLLKRAMKTLRAAKKAGRNQTQLDEGDGPLAVEPPQFRVRGRVVNVAPN